MFGKFSGGSGSLIEARQTAPIALIIIGLLLISAVLVLLYIFVKKITDYRNSDKFRDKEINRKTKYSDVAKFVKNNNLTPNDAKILWEVSTLTEALNINYLLKSNAAVNELFRNAYDIMKEKNLFTDQKLNDFFLCLYKIEMTVAQFKKLTSTRQIPVESIIFYIADSGEQYPFTVKENSRDFFIVEIPDFIATTNRKPKQLVRSRFTFKTSDGLSYNLISRIIRYDVSKDEKNLMIISHTDQLECQAQRNFKREFFQEICLFSSVKKEAVNDKIKYIESEKKYKGKLTNISAGGCCINTTLPIKENQLIGINLPEHGIGETIIGVIKRTRKMPNMTFSLHIQFIQLSLKTKNQIYTMVYKYEL